MRIVLKRPDLLLPALFFLLAVCAAPAAAPAADSNSPPLLAESHSTPTAQPTAPPSTSFVTLFDGRGGRRLLVEYPWSRHRDVSIELRLVTGEQPSVAGVRPLGFVAKHFHGDIRKQIYDVQDAGAGGVVVRTFEVDGADYEILGGRTSLGGTATCIVREYPKAEPPPGAHAVYCLLPSWSINRKLLSIDLPEAHFAETGQMKVWFLRGDTILWSQTLDWPGAK